MLQRPAKRPPRREPNPSPNCAPNWESDVSACPTRIEIAPAAERQIRKLEATVRRRIIDKIGRLILLGIDQKGERGHDGL
jgi:hypothetical protein